jgi:hypothetical protein
MTYAPEFIFLIILSTVTICAFQIFCKTPRLKTDANRFIGKTVCVYFSFGVLQKAQIMPVVSIYDGHQIRSLKDIPFKTARKVIITFLDDFVYETDSEDPIRALRGCSRNLDLNRKLLESRREDSEFEELKWKR